MPRRTARTALALLAIVCCLAACQPTTTLAQAATPTATATLASAATPTAATFAQTAFACPEALDGAQKVFDDAATGLHFSYPAAWTVASRCWSATCSSSGCRPATG